MSQLPLGSPPKIPLAGCFGKGTSSGVAAPLAFLILGGAAVYPAAITVFHAVRALAPEVSFRANPHITAL
jgi:hypothetical protein